MEIMKLCGMIGQEIVQPLCNRYTYHVTTHQSLYNLPVNPVNKAGEIKCTIWGAGQKAGNVLLDKDLRGAEFFFAMQKI